MNDQPESPWTVPLEDLWSGPFEMSNSGPGKWPKMPDFSSPEDLWFSDCHLLPFTQFFDLPAKEYINAFALVDDLAEIADRTTASFDRPITGVMIRKWNSHHESHPVDWYINRMHEIIAVNPEVRFYLAADDVSVDDLVYGTFPSRVSAIKHETDYAWSYNNIRLATADLYILSQVDWMIGSNKSSYCEMVALLRGATKVGDIGKPGCVSGGRYECPWNPPMNNEVESAIGG